MHGPSDRRLPERPAPKASGPGTLCCRSTRGAQVLLRRRPDPPPDVDHELWLNRFATTLATRRHHRP